MPRGVHGLALPIGCESKIFFALCVCFVVKPWTVGRNTCIWGHSSFCLFHGERKLSTAHAHCPVVAYRPNSGNTALMKSLPLKVSVLIKWGTVSFLMAGCCDTFAAQFYRLTYRSTLLPLQMMTKPTKRRPKLCYMGFFSFFEMVGVTVRKHLRLTH